MYKSEIDSKLHISCDVTSQSQVTSTPPCHGKSQSQVIQDASHNTINQSQSLYNPDSVAAFCGVSSTSASTPTPDSEQQARQRKGKLLPPCRVCGEKASGLHYGVNTCEACKGFFRRSISRGVNFQCPEEEICEIKPGRRSNCAACRYRKCLAVGMSKDAIKIGRYTHEKRTQDIREVKNIPSTSKQVDIKPDLTSPTDISKGYDLSQHSTGQDHIDVLSGSETNYLPPFQEQKVIYSMSVVDEMQKFVQRLFEALIHMKYFFAAKPPGLLNHLVQNRLDESKLETELLGEDVMPNTEYVKVMAETGLDLDQRKELIQHWAEGVEETFIVVAEFAKCTPGFKSLSLDDQITLIKATRAQLLFTASHKRFDVKHRCFIGRFNRVESYQDMVKVYNNRQFVDMMLSSAGELVALRLTDIEWLLVLAIIMTYPDEHLFSQLSEQARGHLKVMHNQELRILDFYLKLNHPDQPTIGTQVQKICADVRELNNMHNELVDELQEVWADFYRFPPLFSEIMQFKFKRRVIPRLKPKLSATETEAMQKQKMDTVTSGDNHRRKHWKKSHIIAHILESSEYFDKLMTAAVGRSRDENILPESELLPAIPSCQPPPPHPGQSSPLGLQISSMDSPKPSTVLSSKLNTRYGISFGDRLSPLSVDVEPLSKCLDISFTTVSKSRLESDNLSIVPPIIPSHTSRVREHVPGVSQIPSVNVTAGVSQAHAVSLETGVNQVGGVNQLIGVNKVPATDVSSLHSAVNCLGQAGRLTPPIAHQNPRLHHGIAVDSPFQGSMFMRMVRPNGPTALSPYQRPMRPHMPRPLAYHHPRPVGRGKDDSAFTLASEKHPPPNA